MKLTSEQQKLVSDNYGLVPYVMNNKLAYIPANEYDDCLQYGYIALCKAAISFDSRFGNGFASYAIPAIYRAILRYLSKQYSLISNAKKIVLNPNINTNFNNEYSDECDTKMFKNSVEADCHKLNISSREYMSLLPTLYINDICSNNYKSNDSKYDSIQNKEELFIDKSLIAVDDLVLMENSEKLVEDTINKLKVLLRKGENAKPKDEETVNIFGDWCYGLCMEKPVTYDYLAAKYNKSKQAIHKNINTCKRYILNNIDNEYIKSLIEDLKFNVDIFAKSATYRDS